MEGAMRKNGKEVKVELVRISPVTAVALGHGLSVASFVQLLVVVAGVLVMARTKPEQMGGEQTFDRLTSPMALAALAAVLFWVAPLKEIAYALDRMGAIRAQLHYIAPYTLDLLPTVPDMLPFTKLIIDNIEEVGPFIPICLQPGCKEHMLPLMKDIMPDLKIMLPAADTLAPVLPKIAPHMSAILPYSKELLPYAAELVCVVEVDGWERVNAYLPEIVPHIDRIAPHTKKMAKYLPEMFPYMHILVKHMDKLVDEIDETVGILDRLMPLLPLMPAADQSGLLSQKISFRALPSIIKMSPLSNELSGKAAMQAANIHHRLVLQAQTWQAALVQRYRSYNGALEDSKQRNTKGGEEQEERKEDDDVLWNETVVTQTEADAVSRP